MRLGGVFLGAFLLAGLAAPASAELDSSIAWAYPQGQGEMPFPVLPETAIFRVQGSKLSLTGKQLNDMEEATDWLPGNHPVPPAIVQKGDKARKIVPCGSCHGMNGGGFLNIPDLAALPKAYIVEQLHELASGRRHSSSDGRQPEGYMGKIAASLTEAEIDSTATYFSSLKRHPRKFKVQETDSVPRSYAHSDGWQMVSPEGGSEPLGKRIVLLADNFDQMWAGDPFAMAVAYVPGGSVQRGKEQVQRVGCSTCHGPALKGMGKIPALAGRNPHYLARQLWDIKSGARGGPSVALMQKPAASLNAEQIRDVVAYLASLEP